MINLSNFSSNRRYAVTEDQFGRFTAEDTATGTLQELHFNYTGTANSTTATTWQFAPLDEQRECDGVGFNTFRSRIHDDDQFVANQFKWNRRLDQWHGSTTSTGTNQTLHLTSGACTDATGTYWITSDVARFHSGVLPWSAKHMPYLWNVYCNLQRARTPKLIKRFTKWLLPNPTGEEIQKKIAEKKGMELLKGWLEPGEFDQIVKRGELEIFAEDAVYIVKNDPYEMVIKKNKDGSKRKFCVVPKQMGYCKGDILLSKIMMIKTDPENFEQVANGYDVRE